MDQSGIENQKLKIVVGTRGSKLARWQTQFVIDALKHRAPDLQIETRIIKTSGDKEQTQSLAELGMGMFTKEIERALLSREIDLAIHSLKDLPTDLADGLTIVAILEREDAHDCLVSRHGLGLTQLPRGARVGTSSIRRTAQLLALRSDLQIVPLRGNVDTRLRKAQAKDLDAVILAAAGIIRLGRKNEITEYLPFDWMLPDPGQGALAVEIRVDADQLRTLIARIDHAPTRAAVTAERAFLKALGGGCRTPAGAYAEMIGGQLRLHGLNASPDGSHVARGEVIGDPARAEELGGELAAQLAGATPQRPLLGKRILITRAREQVSDLAKKVRALGGSVIEFPTIEIAPLENYAALDHAIARWHEFDWVIFTSANGARFVSDRLRTLGLAPSALASAKIAAIGPMTGRAVEGIGLRVEFVPTKFLSEQIAAELPVDRGQRALLLRADSASSILAQGLSGRGVVVEDIAAYRTVTPPAQPINLPQVDVITFTSSSTVRNLVALLGESACQLIVNAKVFCIGAVTAATAHELGLRVDAVAAEHTADGLIAAMLEFYQMPERRGQKNA